MNNKIYVDVLMQHIETKSGYEYIKTFVIVKAPSKNDNSKTIELKLTPKKALDINDFQYAGIVYNAYDIKNSIETVKLNHVQARLYKGDYYGRNYYLLKCFIDKHLILSCFLEDTELLMITKYMDINAEFSENLKEKVEFEEINQTSK